MKKEKTYTFNKGGTWLLLLLATLFMSFLPTSVKAQAVDKAQAYACYDASSHTLTFCYGIDHPDCDTAYVVKENFNGKFPGWLLAESNDENKRVVSVVFDKSFRDFKPTSLRDWFYGCCYLESVSGIENLDASMVKTMDTMFRDCERLTSIDLSGLDVHNVTDFGYVFYNCNNLTSVNLSAFDTSKATYISGMFYNCEQLRTLDLSSFSTANVEYIGGMFKNCSSLQTIYVTSKFSTQNVLGDASDMFEGCTNLRGAVSFDPEKTTLAFANTETGYFTYGCRHVDEQNNPLWGDPVHHDISCVTDECNIIKCTVCLDKKVEHISGAPDPTKHTLLKYDLVDSDCRFYGMMEHYECDLCGRMFLDADGIQETDQYSLRLDFDPTKHSIVLVPLHKSTCSSYGMKEHYECEICGNMFLDAEATQQITDDETLRLPLDPTNHNIVKLDPKEPTCETDGNKDCYACMLCDKASYDEAGTKPVKFLSDVFTRRLGHQLNDEGSCQRCGKKIMTLNGVNAQLPGIGNTDWKFVDLAQDGTPSYGFKHGDLFTLELTSDKDFMLKFTVEGLYEAYGLQDGMKRLNIGENSVYFKAGTHKYSMLLSGSDPTLRDIVATTDFTAVPAAKAVYSADTKTLTFYAPEAVPEGSKAYDVPQIVDPDMSTPWCPYYMAVEKVVFDKSFKTFKPTSCTSWFTSMFSLREIEGMENLDVSEAESMQMMFYGCGNLQTLDLSHFNTAKVKYMVGMFDSCTSLANIYAGDGFTTENVEQSNGMFINCYNLQGAISYDGSKTDHSYANTVTGYFAKPCSHQDESGKSTLAKTEDVAANCVKAAYAIYHCSQCDRDIWADFGETAPTMHSYISYETASEPDCNHAGNKDVYSCQDCIRKFIKGEDGTYSEINNIQQAAIAPLGHELDDSYTCSRCGVTDRRYAFLQIPDGVKAVIADNEYPWTFVDESNPAAGLVSSNKERSSTDSRMNIYLTSDKPFEVSFDYKVSSEEEYDKLRIYQDGEEIASVSGERTDSYTMSFLTGIHMLRLEYHKDSSADSGEDMAMITSLSVKQTEAYVPQARGVVVYDYKDNSLTFKAVEAGEAPGEYSAYIDLDNSQMEREWTSIMTQVESIKIDESFSKLRPKSTASWFNGANVKEIEGLQYLNTSETENMMSMFYMANIEKLDLSHFNTEKVKDFAYMFCLSSFKDLDLTSFSTESAEDVSGMFSGCYRLENIYVNKDFSFENVEEYDYAFYTSIFLKGAKPYSVYDDPRFVANYRDGVLKTYYKVGDDKFDLFGDMTVDELSLKQNTPFMTHDAFNARKATLPVAIDDEMNTYNIGTICVPFALAASDDYSLYTVKQLTDADLASSNAKRTSAADLLGSIVLEKVEGTLPAGQPAVFRAKKSNVVFTASSADIVEQPVSDEALARDGYLLSGAFTQYEAEDGFAQYGNYFVSIPQLKGDSDTYKMSPLTAYLKELPGASLSANSLNPVSDDNAFTGLDFIESLSNGKAEIYDINGSRLDTFTKGINIIRRADGKAQKVVVK